MDYKGFDFPLVAQCRTERMKGAVVHLHNNNNGRYGSIEYGKDFTGYNRIPVSEEVEEYLVKIALDQALESNEINEKDYAKIKFNSDFLLGIIAVVNLKGS